ncbi:hypothetical protein NAV33_09620 [Pseudomonas stutzeri]|uniref:hypothetical protein n=1 Tax=Stutzerimonas stutzeri TaxID=316 RepID=UPI00210B1215|nr:hypothetical protein [Stutzerimonas stutzeri]MCQ4312145.1 hypothetical protein [Stutzerimonas stutzeri]
MTRVRINIDLSSGVVDIEGDSDFVDKQITRFEHEIKQQLLKTTSVQKFEASVPGERISNKNAAEQVVESECVSYEDIFEVHDNKTYIVQDVPGKNLKEKIVGVALLLAFAESIAGNEYVLVENIRAECVRHACMDAKHFASYMRAYNTLMIDSGAGKSATLKLTVPGKNLPKNSLSDYVQTI